MSKIEGNSAYVTNLVNSIIGVSVLAMPFCFKQCGLVLGLGLLCGAAWLTYISCSMLATSAFHKRRRTYEYLALYTLGPTGKFAVELSMIGMNLGTCIAFYVVIGDLSNGILSKFVDGADPQTLRMFTIVFCGLCIALPLGLMKSLSILSYFGMFSLLFYCSFLVVVVLNAISNGLLRWEWFNQIHLWRPAGVFQCLPIFSLAYACQAQLFIVYDSLEEPSIRRIEDIVSQAIKFVTVVYMSVGFFGYTTYRELIAGNLLVSFPSNLLLDFIKLGFAMSVVLGFPLIIFPCRQSIHTLFFSKPAGEGLPPNTYIPPVLFKSITLVIILSTMVVAIVIPNVETILGLTGATMGSVICFIFPALIYERASPKGPGGIPKFVFAIGCLLLVVCTYSNLANTGQDQAKAVEHPIVPADHINVDKPVEAVVGDEAAAVVEQPKEELKKPPDTVEAKEEPKAEVAEVIDNEHRHEPANPIDPDNLIEKKDDSPRDPDSDVKEPAEGESKERKPEEDAEKKVAQPADEQKRPEEELKNVEQPIEPKHEEPLQQQKPAVGRQDVAQPGNAADAVGHQKVGKEEAQQEKDEGVKRPADTEHKVAPAQEKEEVKDKEVVHKKEPEKNLHAGEILQKPDADAGDQEEAAQDKELLEKIKQQHEKQQQLLIEQEVLIKKLEEHHEKQGDPKADEKQALKPDGQKNEQAGANADKFISDNIEHPQKAAEQAKEEERPLRDVPDPKKSVNLENDPLKAVPPPDVDAHALPGRELLGEHEEHPDSDQVENESEKQEESRVSEEEEKKGGEDEPHPRAERSLEDGEKAPGDGEENPDGLDEGAGEQSLDAASQKLKPVSDNSERSDILKDDFLRDLGEQIVGEVVPMQDPERDDSEVVDMRKEGKIDSFAAEDDSKKEECQENDRDCWQGKAKTRELKSYDNANAAAGGG